MTNWKYWKDKRLVKHQVAIIIISLLVTIICGFTVVDEEKDQSVGAAITKWDDIKILGPGDITENGNIDLTFIYNHENEQSVAMPWNLYLFYLFHFQIWQSGESGHDIISPVTTSYTGWPFQYMFKFQVQGAETTSNVYEFWEVGPVAFIIDWVIFYLLLAFITLCYYALDIKVFSQQNKKGGNGIKFK